MPREFPRHIRIAENIKRLLAEPLMRAARDAGCGFLTVTNVIVARDLSSARVLVSAFPGQLTRAQFDALKEQRAPMRSLVARDLRLKKVPVLYFEIDETIAKAARIGELLSDSSGGA